MARPVFALSAPFNQQQSLGMDVGRWDVEHSQTASRKAAISWLHLSPFLTLYTVTTVYFAQLTAPAHQRALPGGVWTQVAPELPTPDSIPPGQERATALCAK